MCIIAVKPKGIKTPSKEILQNMFNANSDGAGVAYNVGNTLYLIKGLMTFEEFWSVCQSIPRESGAIYHARIETSGGICRELTHPFILSDNIFRQRETLISINKGEAVAHNGVFSEFDKKDLNSDTTQFITTYLCPLKQTKDKCNGSILDDDLDNIINKLCETSKLAIINQNGDIKRYGKFWYLDNGIYYSNNTYKNTFMSRNFYHSYNFNNWNEHYFDYDEKYVKDRVKYLRKHDTDFEDTYKRLHKFLNDKELLESYENGWKL